MVNTKTLDEEPLSEVDGNYVLDVWAPPASMAPDFARPP